ncbi:glycoside hydrolase family 43 protein [Coniochaeta ligniaria NRRL 30616]|uniref:Glycoside hydrolase family 43 protein n=1 Tax=Coniochaeta ligniaria NRRL 30616 TaxID=1408157 RepID=A0A1J7JHS4_9PEZI|nr:glycoside hydrolase family 43 protein [Coniochaeta ligniaria NRRL 30616]
MAAITLLLSALVLAQATTSTTVHATDVSDSSALFNNPVLYEDFADNDIFRVNNTYYFSASNMHFSPGAPILRSYDLVNWEFVGHSVPVLDFGAQYNLTGSQVAYREGTWASTMRYRKSNGLWYWIGCIDFWNTYVYTAEEVEGPWEQSASMPGNCYYDCGLLIDDDDNMYVVYGGTNVSVAQLSADGLSQAKTQHVFDAADVNRNGIEGNRLYRKDGLYYILDDDSQGTTVIWKASSPFGPYTSKILVNNIASPVPGGGTLDQGSLIETQDGHWYFMSFSWAYPSGRLPVLAPITWGDDGFPVLTTDSAGAWGKSYPYPLPPHPLSNWTGTEKFEGTQLSVAWEWNHNPDPTKYTVSNGLSLRTATVTDDLFHARNTLTHRLHGEFPTGTVAIDFSEMADGDVAGLAAFRDVTSWIGVVRNGNSYTIQVRANATQDLSTWATTSTGNVTATVTTTARKVWFRVALDARASGAKTAQFSHSLDGASFTRLGPATVLSSGWQIFVGYRYGIFNYATKALGGSVKVSEFTSA